MGACTAIMALGALFVAARSGHGVGYIGGLVMFVFCVLFTFFLIKGSFDDA